MENKDKEVTGFDYLWCALYASAAFAIELLLLAIEGKIGFNTQNLTTAHYDPVDYCRGYYHSDWQKNDRT